ncbi:MAG: nitrite reductase small subunit NirD [Candidimonas sp.]|nr:nitrite reductase small subunit NirD [Candidimonas sp.]
MSHHPQDRQWKAVCATDAIPAAGARVVRHDGMDPIALFRTSDGHVFAVVDRCPHLGGPLSAGLVHDHAVTCPLHGWTIGLKDGQAHAPDQGCVRRIKVRVEDNTVFLALPASA